MLRYIDSFATYNTANILSRWTSPIANSFDIQPTAGRHGGPALVFGASNRSVVKVLDNQAHWIVGLAWKSSSLPSALKVMEVRDSSTIQLDVRTDASNHLQVTRNGTVLATSTDMLVAGVFCYIELDATIDNTAGSFTLRVNSQTWLSATGVDTQNTANAYGNTLAFGPVTAVSGSAPTVTICDLYICDGTGSTNNSLLGDVRIDPLFPNSAGDVSDWTANGAASSYNCVNEASPDGDTTYVSSGTPGDYELFKFTGLPSTPVNVFGVMTSIVARKDDAGTREIAPVFRASSTNYDGATIALGGSYATHSEVLETNPDSGVAWIPADLATGTFQAGIKVVT